ncbi:MAG: 50S ribosomal protein L21 [Bdellovibrionales bacterium]
MYAIIRTGGKQYTVKEGDRFRVEKLNAEAGNSVDFTEVLFVGGDKTTVGQPLVAGAKVTVEVVKNLRDKKVRVFKKKRRKGYRKTQGHRQYLTEVVVKSISL